MPVLQQSSGYGVYDPGAEDRIIRDTRPVYNRVASVKR